MSVDLPVPDIPVSSTRITAAEASGHEPGSEAPSGSSMSLVGIAARPDCASGALNQPPPLAGYNPFVQNRPLVDALEREGADWSVERATSFAERLAGEPVEWARLANEHPPKLRTHDRFGNRINEVEFHPAWHCLMETAVTYELHALPWRTSRAGAHVGRAALFYLAAQIEAGHTCPLSMTHAAVPALRAQPELADVWEPLLTSVEYDPGLEPAASAGRRSRTGPCPPAPASGTGRTSARCRTTCAR